MYYYQRGGNVWDRVFGNRRKQKVEEILYRPIEQTNQISPITYNQELDPTQQQVVIQQESVPQVILPTPQDTLQNVYTTRVPQKNNVGSNQYSIVDYLNSTNKKSDFNERKKLAQEKGVSDYRGTARQNLELLRILKNEQNDTTTTRTPNVPNTVTPSKSEYIDKILGNKYGPTPQEEMEKIRAGRRILDEYRREQEKKNQKKKNQNTGSNNYIQNMIDSFAPSKVPYQKIGTGYSMDEYIKRLEDKMGITKDNYDRNGKLIIKYDNIKRLTPDEQEDYERLNSSNIRPQPNINTHSSLEYLMPTSTITTLPFKALGNSSTAMKALGNSSNIVSVIRPNQNVVRKVIDLIPNSVSVIKNGYNNSQKIITKNGVSVIPGVRW